MLFVIGCLSLHAAAAEPAKLKFDTYSGYFVSNRFEPNAAESFVVINDQEHFDTVFGAAFVALSVVLAALLWAARDTIGLYAPNRGLLPVSAVSAMLASRGFTWKRKLTYAGLTLGIYILFGALAAATGLHARAAYELNNSGPFPSALTMVYLAFLMAFPLAMLVLFVGRRPSSLWVRTPK